jgi:hypothetical protein
MKKNHAVAAIILVAGLFAGCATKAPEATTTKDSTVVAKDTVKDTNIVVDTVVAKLKK